MLDPERFRRLKSLFHAAVEQPAAAREALLAESLDDDPTLKEHLRELLAAHEEPEDALVGGGLAALPGLHADLDSRMRDEAPAAPPAATPGRRIGPYRVISELGRGGMGAVYLARRDDGTFEQEVAVKLIKRGMDSDEIVRRFVHERQILAALQHPYIARLLDGGTTDDGRPYFVLEHVDGRPITAWADSAGLGLDERLRLFLKVTEAVQYAHRNLVVHRDLKPANILVGPDGSPKLLDFGIAKLLGDGRPGWTQTALADQPLTPDYASPEQLAGQPVTTATDVHGLGLLLYELVVGGNPAAVERLLGAGWRERPASQAAAAVARLEGRTPRFRLPRDLDTILAKALAPDPGRRYGTAAELADDLLRHLDRRPVRARRPTPLYLLGRAVQRHRLAALFALAFLGFTVAVSWLAVERNRQWRRAEASNLFLAGLFRAADPEHSLGTEIRARALLDAGAKVLQGETGTFPPSLLRELGGLASDPATRADLLATIGEVQTHMGLRDEAEKTLLAAAALDQGRTGREGALAQARVLAALASLDLENSRYDRSRMRYERALALRRQFLGERSPEVADALNGLGLAAYGTHDFARAEPLFRRALAIRRGEGEVGRLAAAGTLANLGAVALEQERLAEAARDLEESLALHRQLVGASHPDTLRVLSNLAVVRFRSGDATGAAANLGEIVDIRRRVLGVHPDVARSLANLAAVQESLGRLAEAEASLRRALELRRQLSLTEDEDYANAVNSLVAILRQRGGDLAAAADLATANLALYRRLLGADHFDTINAANGLAMVELERGRTPAAEALVRAELSRLRQRHGPETPRAALSWNLLGRILKASGRLAEAEAAFRRALALRRQRPGPDNASTADSLSDLGDLLVAEGRAAEAASLLEQALAFYRRQPLVGVLTLRTVEGRLGACYLALGRRREARPLLEASHRGLATSLGPGHPRTREVARLLAS